MKRVLAFAIALAWAPAAQALPVNVTGSISMSVSSNHPFDDVWVRISGEDFSVVNSPLRDSFRFLSAPNPVFGVRAGELMALTGAAFLQDADDRLIWAGASYQVSGRLDVFVPLIPVAAFVTAPMTLTGELVGTSLDGGSSISLGLTGEGIVNASFIFLDGYPYALPQSIVYTFDATVVPTPEPATWVLVATGAVLRRRRLRARLPTA